MTETNFNELKNNSTLAPLKEGMYNPQNLNNHDRQLLAQISKSSLQSIESSIGVLQHLVSNLQMYKTCLIDSINLQSESADMATKYAKDIPQQSHTLPGVVTIPQSYDLESLKKDNTRMEEIKDLKDKAVKQKDIYMRLCDEDVRLFLGSWKRLNYSNASFDEFVLSLNDEINQNY